MLYQLSYFRKNKPSRAAFNACPIGRLQPRPVHQSGKRWIRTTEGVRQQIYSLPHLATLVSSQLFSQLDSFTSQGADGGIRTHDPEITNHVLWPTELHRHFNRLRDAKVGIFFIFANFSQVFFSTLLKNSANRAHLARSKNGDFRPSKVKVGKSSANITTLSLIKKQMKVFFAKKLKKYRYPSHLYI